MPSNTEGSKDMEQVNSAELPSDGQFHPFEKYDRYYTESAAGWRSVTVQNTLTQFICIQILQTTATVIVVNMSSEPVDGRVSKFGPTAKTDGTVVIAAVSYQSYQAYVQENSGTCVWMNGDSRQNSANAGIALQQLSLAEGLLLNGSGIS
jgi:hypothetical protein